jgi:hypothetical protein
MKNLKKYPTLSKVLAAKSTVQAGNWDITAEDLVDFTNNVEPLYLEAQSMRTMRQAEALAEEVIDAYKKQSPGHKIVTDVSELAEALWAEFKSQ